AKTPNMVVANLKDKDELQQIKSYSQKLGKSELSLADLESNSNTGSPGKDKGTNYWP
ncbi:706_t:CDS:1, partial [Cetraspora pellucida]